VRIVYFGTPEFAVPSLRALVAGGHEVALVVTQPDRPAGRGYRLALSPVKGAAVELGLPLAQPERVAEGGFPEELRRLAPEACVVVAFGQKIPADLLALPPAGWINVHASLLPRWRGAAPVARAIMAGDEVTGVTTMYLDLGWDTGDMILRREMPIDPEEDAGRLLGRLAEAGAEALGETMALIAQGTAPREKQDETRATVAPRLMPAEGEVEWSRSAAELHNQVRGLSPSPGAFTFWRGRRLKLCRTAVGPAETGEVSPATAGAEPGTVHVAGREASVATGAGRLRLLEVQGEGGKVLPADVFARGQRWETGERLGGKG
jgi:methionyl-tRNA formyltransferase